MDNANFDSKTTAGLCQAIIARMPPQRVYIESHLGGGDIMKRKSAAQCGIGIEIDACAIGQLLKMMCGRQISESTLLKWVRPPASNSERLGTRSHGTVAGDAGAARR